MKKSIMLLSQGFESSSGLTPEFAEFAKIFKSEITKELKAIGAKDIKIGRGHFYLSGFFTHADQVWYISLSDVRWSNETMLYRKAKSYSDYTGGSNMYVDICPDMVSKMQLV